MDRSSSLSRSDSRSSLEDSSDSSPHETRETEAAPVQPSLTQGRRRAGTWTSAMVPPSPRSAQEKSSEPTLKRRGLERQATASTYRPTGHATSVNATPSTANSSTTTTSTVTSASNATSTSTAAASPQSSNTPVASSSSSRTADVGKKISLSWSDLPDKIKSVIRAGLQREGTLSGKALGMLVVAIESGAGSKVPEARSGGAPILRGAQIIHGYSGDQTPGDPGKDINIIERFVQPFLHKHLDTPELKEVRQKVQRNYENVHKKLSGYDTSNLRPKQALELEGYKDVMTEVIKPLIDYLLGPALDLKASGLRGPMKDLLQSVDADMVKWLKVKGPEDLEEQFMLRRSAMTSLLAVRGLGFIWKQEFSKVKKTDQQFFQRLLVFFNAYMNHKLDRLYLAIMLKTENQPDDIKGLLKGKALRERQGMNTIHSPRGKPSMMGKIGQLFSSSGSESNKDVPLSPRDASVMAKSMKESETRKLNVERKRAAKLNDFARELRLADFSPVFMKQLKEKVTDSREQFAEFKKEPATYCLKQMEAYVAELAQQNKPVPDNYQAFRNKLARWAAEGATDSASEETSPRQVLSTVPTSSATTTISAASSRAPRASDTFTASTTGPTIFSSSSAISLDLSKLRKSPFADEESASRTEPSDSTDVETESSNEPKS